MHVVWPHVHQLPLQIGATCTGVDLVDAYGPLIVHSGLDSCMLEFDCQCKGQCTAQAGKRTLLGFQSIRSGRAQHRAALLR